MVSNTGQHLHSTDRLLAIIIGLTTVDISFQIAGRPVGLGDLLLIPVLLLVLGSSDRRALPSDYTLATLGYLAWCVIALFWTQDITAAIGPAVQYIEFLFLVPLTFMQVRNLRGAVAIVRFYVFCASVLATLTLTYAAVEGIFSYVYFLNYQKNYLGAIMGNAIPLILGLCSLTKTARWKLALALALCGAALLVSSSRGSWLGAIMGIAVFLLLNRRIRYGLLFAALCVSAFWAYFTFVPPASTETLSDFSEGSSAHSRTIIFEDAIRFISNSPIIGHGPGSYMIEIPSINFSQRDPSNVFLLALAELGVVGLILLLFLLACIISCAVRNLRLFREKPVYLALSAALFGGFISQLTHIQIDVAWVRGTGTFMFACVGMMMALPSLAEVAATDRRSSISNRQ